MENSDKIIDKIAENTAAELNDSDLEKVSGGVEPPTVQVLTFSVTGAETYADADPLWLPSQEESD